MAASQRMYEGVAEGIRNTLSGWKGEAEEVIVTGAVRQVAINIAHVFKADNSRFNKERFFKACGLEI